MQDLREELTMWLAWLDTAEGAFHAYPLPLRRRLASQTPEADTAGLIAHLSAMSPATRRHLTGTLEQLLDAVPEVSSPCRFVLVDGGGGSG